MDDLDAGDVHVLNVVQSVMRGVLLSIASADLGRSLTIARMLEACAADGAMDEAARAMLADLAAGVAALAAIGQTRQ